MCAGGAASADLMWRSRTQERTGDSGGTDMVKNFTDLTGRKAIVTGAAQGLSRGMAEGLMEAGAEVAIIDLNQR